MGVVAMLDHIRAKDDNAVIVLQCFLRSLGCASKLKPTYLNRRADWLESYSQWHTWTLIWSYMNSCVIPIAN